MNCPVPSIRYAHGACINCGLSGGITLSIAFHTDDDNFGGSCTLAARDRLLSISWYAYRNAKGALTEKFSLVIANDQEYAKWLVKQDDSKLENMRIRDYESE